MDYDELSNLKGYKSNILKHSAESDGKSTKLILNQKAKILRMFIPVIISACCIVSIELITFIIKKFDANA